MEMPSFNFLAVLVAGLVIFALGGLWYSPILFAKRWIGLQGRTEEQMRADAARANMPLMYASVLLCGLLTAFVLDLLIVHLDPHVSMTPFHGALLGFFCWLGFAATTSYGTSLFSMRPRALWVIDSTYNLVSFVLAGIILAAWR
ncbi:MAG TPA: DUF1761 domain-containing protein [Gemmatimonadaceae bacterium]|nr:DUF1761 domain-containing protein [Gemmatimonadaceae bacterium]